MSGTYTNLLYHLVFSTKLRKPWITAPIRDELYKYMGGIIRGERGVLLEIGGTADHVHLLTRFKTQPSVAEMLQRIKANSSKWVNEEKTRIHKFGWQDGYGAFTVSHSQVGRVRRYIKTQAEHHRVQDFKVEFRTLLDKHGIEYEERHLWD